MAAYWLLSMGGSVSTARAALARLATGSSSSGSSGTMGLAMATLHCPHASSTMPMTAKAPQWESFRIRRRSGRSRRLSTASHTSMKPSRCRKPVASHGAAASSSPPTVAGRNRARYAASTHTAPTTPPASGRQQSILLRALSRQIFRGQGMARNMPHAMKKPQIQSFTGATLLSTHGAPPPPCRTPRQTPPPDGGTPTQAPGRKSPSSRHSPHRPARYRRRCRRNGRSTG